MAVKAAFWMFVVGSVFIIAFTVAIILISVAATSQTPVAPASEAAKIYHFQDAGLGVRITRVNRALFLITDLYSAQGLNIPNGIEYMRLKGCTIADMQGVVSNPSNVRVTVANGESCLPNLY